MYSLVDYTILGRHSGADFNHLKTRIKFQLSIPASIQRIFLKRFVVKSLKGMRLILQDQMLRSKGLYASVQERFPRGSKGDISALISSIDELIKDHIELKAYIERMMARVEYNNISTNISLVPIVDESLENYYAISALLKRANRKAGKDSSPIVDELSNMSFNTIERILNER